MIPDISVPLITIEFDIKYEIMLRAYITKVSVIGFILKNDICLNKMLVINPITSPTPSEITASMINSAKIINGVTPVKFVVKSDFTVLYKIIATISFATPSPKTQLNNFGYFS